MSKIRHACITINNYEKDWIPELLEKNHQYIVIGKEVGEQGTPHLQIYVEFKNSRSFKAVHKEFHKGHIESRKGTAKQAADYCKKGKQPKPEWEKDGCDGENFGLEADFQEDGICSKQGVRTDINEVVESIIDGETTVDEIVLANPGSYARYGRTLDRAEDIIQRKKWRTWTTKAVWYWGPTGVGKSHFAFENYDPEKYYVKSVNQKEADWWDGYTGQETVIINEFRGQITYAELLDLMDKWPKKVSRRCREPMPFLAKDIIITSCSPPEEVYCNLAAKDSLAQLYRRCEVRHIAEKGESGAEHKCPVGNTKPLDDEW